MKFTQFSLLQVFLLLTVLASIGCKPSRSNNPATPLVGIPVLKEQQALLAASLKPLIPMLKSKGYSKPDDTTIVGDGNHAGRSVLFGACLDSSSKPHDLTAEYACTKFGDEYTVELLHVEIDSETIYLADGYGEGVGSVYKKISHQKEIGP